MSEPIRWDGAPSEPLRGEAAKTIRIRFQPVPSVIIAAGADDRSTVNGKRKGPFTGSDAVLWISHHQARRKVLWGGASPRYSSLMSPRTVPGRRRSTPVRVWTYGTGDDIVIYNGLPAIARAPDGFASTPCGAT